MIKRYGRSRFSCIRFAVKSLLCNIHTYHVCWEGRAVDMLETPYVDSTLEWKKGFDLTFYVAPIRK